LSETLQAKYRPKVFSDLIGQTLTAIVLNQMVQQRELPEGFLLSGPKGTGKTSVARIISSSLEADVIELDAASNGTVDDVRKLIEQLRYSSGSVYRVVIWDEAQSMSREAFNALLKTLEEPPADTIFILVTTEPEKIPEPVQSRLTEFTFNKISAAEIKSRLLKICEAEGFTVADDLLTVIAERADGSARDGIKALDFIHRSSVSSIDEYNVITGFADTAPGLLLTMLEGDAGRTFEMLEEQLLSVSDPAAVSSRIISCLRDVLVLRSGGSIHLTGDGLDARKELAHQLEPERILAVCRILWDLKTKIRVSDDPRGNLELAIILVQEALMRGREPLTPVKAPEPVVAVEKPGEAAPVAPRTLSLADLQMTK